MLENKDKIVLDNHRIDKGKLINFSIIEHFFDYLHYL